MSNEQTTADLRSQILEQLRPIGAAWSVNGRDVQFLADFDLDVETGGFLSVVTPAGSRLLVQVHELRSSLRQSVRIEIDVAEMGVDNAAVKSADVALNARVVEGSGLVLAAVDADGAATQGHGFNDGRIAPATDAEIDEVMSAAVSGGSAGSGITIGRLRGSEVPARLKASGFARHTFLCGQSGSGKTFTLGVVLERLLLETDLPFVVIDPNSDYVHLGEMVGRTTINRFRSSPMTRDEHAALRDRYTSRADVGVASSRGGDLPLRIHLSDLMLEEQALVMRLDALADADEFSALAEAARSLGDRYSPADLRSALHDRFDDASRRLAQRIQNLGIADWSVWAHRDEASLATTEIRHRATILDTGSMADPRERSVVALALLGRLRRRPQRSPISVVIDEAHNVCSPDSSSLLERAVTGHTLWIAGEGRKFGIYLFLSTQRPQKIHRNVLSQCDNLMLMRVNSTSDLDELAQVFSHVPASMVAEASSHRMGEMLVAGPIAPTPLRLQVAERWTREGGADLPSNWARPVS